MSLKSSIETFQPVGESTRIDNKSTGSQKSFSQVNRSKSVKDPKSENTQDNRPKKQDSSKVDHTNDEFAYYVSLLKDLTMWVENSNYRRIVMPWVLKLFRPEYHTSILREKRNRYLLQLTLNLLNEELSGAFKKEPPKGKLDDIECLPLPDTEPSDWESETMWEEEIKRIPKGILNMPCAIHGDGECPEIEPKIDIMMDKEFKFFLYLARPYVSLLPVPEDRTKVSGWLQKLCGIHPGCCVLMKGLRNDYIQAFLGCISDLRISGPFQEYPPQGPLPPLADMARYASSKHPFTDPTSFEADNFLADQPFPEEGAFCFVCVSGELVNSTDSNASSTKSSKSSFKSSSARTSMHSSFDDSLWEDGE